MNKSTNDLFILKFTNTFLNIDLFPTVKLLDDKHPILNALLLRSFDINVVQWLLEHLFLSSMPLWHLAMLLLILDAFCLTVLHLRLITFFINRSRWKSEDAPAELQA